VRLWFICSFANNQRERNAYWRRHNGMQNHAAECTHERMPTQMLYGHTRAHARTLMRYFLTFLHVPLENIDESPFKNNSCLVGSLSDLQFYCQHIIITFIMSDRAGPDVLWWEVGPPQAHGKKAKSGPSVRSALCLCFIISHNVTAVTVAFRSLENHFKS